MMVEGSSPLNAKDTCSSGCCGPAKVDVDGCCKDAKAVQEDVKSCNAGCCGSSDVDSLKIEGTSLPSARADCASGCCGPTKATTSSCSSGCCDGDTFEDAPVLKNTGACRSGCCGSAKFSACVDADKVSDHVEGRSEFYEVKDEENECLKVCCKNLKDEDVAEDNCCKLNSLKSKGCYGSGKPADQKEGCMKECCENDADKHIPAVHTKDCCASKKLSKEGILVQADVARPISNTRQMIVTILRLLMSAVVPNNLMHSQKVGARMKIKTPSATVASL
ncbi:hypothetical protein BDQ17DRAFT_795533 [Cyathus striatus]|nr:hypothetical protein BDQ17DRAFT_795533 [Cyathus striatus]